MTIPTIPWDSYIYRIGDGPMKVALPSRAPHFGLGLPEKATWFKRVEPEPGMLIAVRLEHPYRQRAMMPGEWRVLSERMAEFYREEGLADIACILPAVPPDHLRVALRMLLGETSDTPTRGIYGLDLEAGMIELATWGTEMSLPYYRMPAGECCIRSQETAPHMRDMQKYGALLEYLRVNGGAE